MFSALVAMETERASGRKNSAPLPPLPLSPSVLLSDKDMIDLSRELGYIWSGTNGDEESMDNQLTQVHLEVQGGAEKNGATISLQIFSRLFTLYK